MIHQCAVTIFILHPLDWTCQELANRWDDRQVHHTQSLGRFPYRWEHQTSNLLICFHTNTTPKFIIVHCVQHFSVDWE
jgi:hypothetical protein